MLNPAPISRQKKPLNEGPYGIGLATGERTAGDCLLAGHFVDHQEGHFQQNALGFPSYLPANCGELYSGVVSLQGVKAAFFAISKRLLIRIGFNYLMSNANGRPLDGVISRRNTTWFCHPLLK